MNDPFGAAPLAWERLLEAGEIDERLVTTSVEASRPPSIVDVPRSLAPALIEALSRAGITHL